MLVNHIQVAYVLQITPLEAKFMLAPHIERIREMVIPGKKGLDECARLVRETDVVESLLLNIRFRHPSPELDGKDRIAKCFFRPRFAAGGSGAWRLPCADAHQKPVPCATCV